MSDTIWFDKQLLRSQNFRGLKKWSMLIYLDFLRKRKMEKVKGRPGRSNSWLIKNNGEIVYPYCEAEHKGIGRREFRNAIDELVEKGFLDIAHQGSGGRAGDMTKYIISDRWVDFGTQAFKPPLNPRKKDTREGRGWAAFHAKKEKFSITKSIPKMIDSSNEVDTPKRINNKVSNNNSDTPKTCKKKATVRNDEKDQNKRQLKLWSNDSVTIL